MADGGTWNTIAGQPGDDSEMTLILARVCMHTLNNKSQTNTVLQIMTLQSF